MVLSSLSLFLNPLCSPFEKQAQTLVLGVFYHWSNKTLVNNNIISTLDHQLHKFSVYAFEKFSGSHSFSTQEEKILFDLQEQSWEVEVLVSDVYPIQMLLHSESATQLTLFSCHNYLLITGPCLSIPRFQLLLGLCTLSMYFLMLSEIVLIKEHLYAMDI